MTERQRRYIATEAMIGATISAVLSVVFVLLMFGRLSHVPVAGPAGLIMDALPQGFAIALMATLVPTWLTRRRLARGAILPTTSAHTTPPAHLLVRGIGMAALGAALTVGLTALMLVVGVDDLELATVLIGKTIWGFILGGTVAALMTRAALARH